MKKLLLFIFSLFFGLNGFSSAISYELVNDFTAPDLSLSDNSSYTFSGLYFFGSFECHFRYNDSSCSSDYFDIGVNTRNSVVYFDSPTTLYLCNLGNLYPNDYGWCLSSSEIYFGQGILPDISGGGSSTPSDITVYYNNGQTTSIACNGDNIITIDGLSTMSSISTFTPFFNINYTDQNNQVLTDSYSNSILYLSGGQFLKTYTGGSNNDWILNLVTSEDIVFTGYLPTFNVTGNITEIDTGNVFNNFAENSLTVLLSNIPNYIQYVIMFALLLFFLGIFRRLRK